MNGYNIPDNILQDIGVIRQGKCTLFLGAGASQCAKTAGGESAPSGDELSAHIADKFLGDPTWKLSLETAASLASARWGNRNRLEEIIEQKLFSLEPTPAHKKIPWFAWRALVTTNYDRLIEKAYDNPQTVQKLFAILDEKDLRRVGRSDTDVVTLLKPHGCISRPESMCLSSENIHQAKQKRRLLFSYIEMLHLEGPVIYIGYSLRDTHILSMIYDLNDRLVDYRQPIIFVTNQESAVRAEVESHWFQDKLRAGYLSCGFESFMDALSRQITPAIGPSMIIEQMAPCRVQDFSVHASCYQELYEGPGGEWVYWLKYSIQNEDGFAGAFFETKGEPVDMSGCKKIKFQLHVSEKLRAVGQLEAFKLEGYHQTYVNLLDIEKLRGKGWMEVEIDLDEYNVQEESDVHKLQLRRIVIADHGSRVVLHEEYKIGIRRIRFE